jgi:hypothetical protein
LEFFNRGQQCRIALECQQASADNITQPSRQATIAANGFNLLPLMRGNQPRDIR